MASKLSAHEPATFCLCVCMEIGKKVNFFGKTLRTQKFSAGKFFGDSTHGIITHSGFRKYSQFWVTEPQFLSYSGSNWGHRKKTVVLQKIRGIMDQSHSTNFRPIARKRIKHELIWSPCFNRFQVIRRKLAEWLWSITPQFSRNKSRIKGQIRLPITRP